MHSPIEYHILLSVHSRQVSTASTAPQLRRGGCSHISGADSVAALGAAFVAQYAGLLAERWYLVAEAKHPPNLYYQAIS